MPHLSVELRVDSQLKDWDLTDRGIEAEIFYAELTCEKCPTGRGTPHKLGWANANPDGKRLVELFEKAASHIKEEHNNRARLSVSFLLSRIPRDSLY